MNSIRTVVCPVDFSLATSRQIGLAGNICRAFGAQLVVHHNVTDVSAGAAVGWMWHADHVPVATESVDEQLRVYLNRVPKEVEVETCITRGAAAEGVLAVSDAADADLVVLCEHAGKAEDHASVIEFMLERSSRALLALHDQGADLAVPRFVADDGEQSVTQAVVVPVNVNNTAHPQVDLACDLARLFPLRLELLHVIESGAGESASSTATRQRLHDLVPPDLASRASIHVGVGDPVAAIVQTARRLSAVCIVMGEHTRVPFKRWFKRDTSRGVLHEAHCPVWYVPTRAAAARSFERVALSDKKSGLWGNA
jgi:nucleotide-binding universal stress UspA family protein